jgi:integrase
VHVTCLGLGPHAYAAGVFTCAECVKDAAKLPDDVPEALEDAAHRVVWLQGMRVRESSQQAYASSLHRYVKFWQEIGGKSLSQILPPGAGSIQAADIHLFLGWAMSRYKYNTILSTVSALINWHKDKEVAYDALTCTSTRQMLSTIKAEQGPQGMPAGKTGMSKEVLRLVLSHLHARGQSEPRMHALFMRDATWLVLGFYGMLRRSEITALQMRDISVGQMSNDIRFVEITIRKSKNDRRGEGAVVTITGKTQDGVRVAERVEQWLDLRARAGASPSDPLFPTWDLDTYSLSSSPIRTPEALNQRLKMYLTGLKQRYPDIPVNPASYGMHSLRRGGVMAAWKAGVDVEKIKAHGRWKSDAIRAYMQTTRDMRLVVTQRM